MSQDIKYNTYSFQTTSSAAATILTRDIRYKSIADKTIMRREDTIRDGWDFIDEHYSQKIVTISGWLISDSAANLRTFVDNVKGYLRPQERNLDIETYGGSGRYIRYANTVVQSFRIEEEFWQISQVPYTCDFLCEPFGKATSTTSVNLNSGGAISASPYNENVSITGTYRAKPTITITVNSETDMTVLKWDNTTTGDWLQVSASFNNSDVLVIDCENETVKLNGTYQDFTGVFPNFLDGTNSLTLTITATVFSISASFSYYPTYL